MTLYELKLCWPWTCSMWLMHFGMAHLGILISNHKNWVTGDYHNMAIIIGHPQTKYLSEYLSKDCSVCFPTPDTLLTNFCKRMWILKLCQDRKILHVLGKSMFGRHN
jgi:hypothetical protein